MNTPYKKKIIELKTNSYTQEISEWVPDSYIPAEEQKIPYEDKFAPKEIEAGLITDLTNAISGGRLLDRYMKKNILYWGFIKKYMCECHKTWEGLLLYRVILGRGKQ